MIGGKDILIPTSPGPAALDLALRAISRRWPSAVFENAETGDMFDTYGSLGFGPVREILAYKDKEAARQWHELGADETLVGTMIHVLVSAAGLTLVVDSNPPLEVSSLVTAIRDGLNHGIFARIHRRPAA
ncbi:MAG: hypothetical protein HY718_13460 [Planctomycetes bacterium]|nr:hypothetical protein [Planctomycetota bacterium]